MIKNHYKKELVISQPCALGAKGNDVLRIQEWLSLYEFIHPGSGTATGVDGEFGAGTDTALRTFQFKNGLPVNGNVDAGVFAKLSEPVAKAFDTPVVAGDLRNIIVGVAEQHLANHAYELTIKGVSNVGPWVRSYCDGNEGESWFWCMGFVQSILDQAASQMGKDFRTLMPQSYSCDTIGTIGLHKKILTRYSDVRTNPSSVRPGDIFLLQQSPNDWFHTGLITRVTGGCFETIEGNTNVDGSNNGNGVYKRVRNFMNGSSKIDVFSIEQLVRA